jgi:hypothetical protein
MAQSENNRQAIRDNNTNIKLDAGVVFLAVSFSQAASFFKQRGIKDELQLSALNIL